MALTCPRCGTDVPNEAQYCPYCSMPKPKRGFAVAAEAKPEETKRTEQTTPAVAFRSSNKDLKLSRPPKTLRRLRLPVVSVAALVALLSVGAYIFVVPLVYSEEAEPKIILSALDTLKRMPSNEAGLTIDARLMRDLETSRRVRNLVSYQGWTVRPINGTKTKVLMAFSYQEVGDVNQRAEWIADLTSITFIPQTELAAAVVNR
ncbi:MAG: zinc ribbon domain-containing protein [Acidobacteriota bacterium]